LVTGQSQQTVYGLSLSLISVAGLSAILLACSTANKPTAGTPATRPDRASFEHAEVEFAGKGDRGAVASSSVEKQPTSRAPGRYLIGKAYQVAGNWFEPKEDAEYDRTGTASWYGSKFHGRRTANGEVFDRTALTAAHPTLPLPSYVRVT
jgi:rare lipoprotein A